MKWPFLSTLRARLLLLVMLALLPAAVLIVYSGIEQRQDANEKVREDASTLVELSAAQQERVIEGARQLLIPLALISSGSDLTKLNAETCGAVFSALLRQFSSYSNLGIALPNGDVVCSGVALTQPASAADRAWFQRSIETRTFAVGDYQVGRITGTAALNVGYPIIGAAGEVKAVVFLAIDLDYMNQTIASQELPNGAVVVLFDRHGTVLARSVEPEQWAGQRVTEEMLQASSEGAIRSVPSVDGLTRTFAFSPIGDPTSGLHAGVGIDADIALVAADQQLRRNLFALAAVAVLALCAAWFGGDAFILRRARALVATTERLRAGDFSARTGQVRDGSELGQLASSFDEMAETLEHREAERDAAQAELARRNEELESFTYSVSHDLKEPLRTVKTYSQFLLQDYRDAVDADGKEFLEGIGSASVRMARLIDELLLLSRLSKEAPAVRVETNELLEDIVRSLGGAIEAKQATVTVEPGLPAVYAHSERVAQVLTNLISNALKFNDGQTPAVEIGKAAESGGIVTFYVRDNGVGIDAEFHEQIFGLFKRLNRREDYDGTGAGLAIAKRAVEVSGGQIWLESTPGAGSTFFFTLPLWQGAANTLVAA